MSLRKYFKCSDRNEDESEKPASKRSRTEEPDSSSDGQDSDAERSSSSRVQTSTTTENSAAESSTHSGRQKQASTFSKDWLRGREHWLNFVHGKGMFCTLCQKYNKSPFSRGTWNTAPCTRLRLQSITAHEHSATHKDSLKLESDQITIQSALNPVVPSKGIEQAFLSLYFLAKQRISHTTNFEPLLDLLALLRLNVKSKIQIAKNALYTSDKAVQECYFRSN